MANNISNAVGMIHCACMSDGNVPVSYTHLDVYKRQVPDSTNYFKKLLDKQNLKLSLSVTMSSRKVATPTPIRPRLHRFATGEGLSAYGLNV